ncbi:hypothetical protein LSCM4_07390 [Leishmania orientalis]|uniref:Protein kinase domain-containing protein n=1 Tax=Leishmania orientalis TaxID=2249476 RepID=A0A836H7X4_9TRYP|nr:hypothetical protein LSCM4_07390 [Leishmania orientalis]
MNLCSSSRVVPPLWNSFADAASSALHAADALDSGVAAYALASDGCLGGRNVTRKLANSGVDGSRVLFVLVCLLLAVTVVMLIFVLRLLERVAAAAAAAVGSRAQNTLSDDLGAEEETLYVSVGVEDDEEEAAFLRGTRDRRTQVEEDASLQQPLLHRVCGRGTRAGRHRRDSGRRQQHSGRRTSSRAFAALRVPLRVSTAVPPWDESSNGEMVASRSGWRGRRTGCSAVPTPGSRAASRWSPSRQRHIRRRACAVASVAHDEKKDTSRPGLKSVRQNSGSLAPSGAARKCDGAAVAVMSPSLALVAADHGGTQHGVDVSGSVFTATTEKDMVVYNHTHDSRYRILQRIGMGAFSSVYLVQHKTSGRKFALKYILCKDNRERQAALRECEVLHCLQGHPQVIRIVDMFMRYPFPCAPASPTVAGYPTISTRAPRRREHAAADQSLWPSPDVRPHAPAAIASAASPAAVHHAGVSQSLPERPSVAATRTAPFLLSRATDAVLSQRRLFAAAAAPASLTTSRAAVQMSGLSIAEMTKVAGPTGLEDAVAAVALRARNCAQAMDNSSTEYHAAVQDQDDDVNCGGMHTAAEGQRKSRSAQFSVNRQYRSPYFATGFGRGSADSDENGDRRQRGRQCVHSIVGGDAHGANVTDANHVSGMETGECTSRNHLSAVNVGDLDVHQQPQPEGKQSMSAPYSHYTRPPRHREQHASQGRSSVHPCLGATATTSTTPIPASCPAALAGSAYAPMPLLAAAGGRTRGYGHAASQPVSRASTALLTTALAAPAAVTGAPPPTRSEARRDESQMCCPATVAPGAVVDNGSNAAPAAFVSVGCCTTDGMTTTATATQQCLPSTTHNTTGSPSSGVSHERGTLEDCDGVDDAHSSEASRRRAKWRTDLRADASAEETRSGGSDDARSIATTSSGTQEEPTQPIYRILVPPSKTRPPVNGMAAAPGGSNGAVPQLPNCTYASGEESTTAPYRSSSSPAFRAGGLPVAAGPVSANCSAAPSPAGEVLQNGAVGSLPAAACPPPRGMASNIVHTFATTPPQQQQQQQQLLTCIFSAPQLQSQQERSQPMPSMAALYSTARPAASSTDASGAAAGALVAGGPIRYRDFVPSVTTSTALWTPATATQANGDGTSNDAEDGRAHAQWARFHESIALFPYGATAAATAGSGAPAAGVNGLAPDRPTSTYANPYLERARGGEPVPPPRTSYAPGGGVRYNSLILPYVAAPTERQPATNGLRVQPSSASSLFTMITNGTCTSALDARKESGSHELRSEVTDADRSSQGTCASASASYAARVASPQPLWSDAAATATKVRNTYAPLRYENVVQSGAASLATSSMPCSFVLPSSPPPQQQVLPQSSYAVSPVASHTPSSGPLSMPKAIRGARMGHQGESVQQKDGTPHASVLLHSTDKAVTPTQAPPSLPLRSLTSLASGAYLTRPAARANGAGTVACTTTPQAPYGEARQPAAATAQCDATSSIKPLYANLGVLTGPGATGPLLRTSDDADGEHQRHYGDVRSCVAAPSPVRYINAANPNPWDVCSAKAVPAHAASAAAVSELTNAHSKTGARTSIAACAGAGGSQGNKSSTTTQTTVSSDLPHDARDNGYLCLVMDYHPMGDLCGYALRAKHQLEMRHHRQQQPPLQALARGGAMSTATPPSIASPATATALTSERSSFQQPHAVAGYATKCVDGSAGVDGVLPSAPLSSGQSQLTHGGTAVASSMLAAAAAATWTAKVAMSRTDLRLALSAGVGSGGSTFGCHAAGGLDAQARPAVAVDPTSDNPLTEAQLLSIAYQLASVLDHMHRQNPPIIHRDLKPENVLIKGELSDYLDLPRFEALTNISSIPSSSVSPAHPSAAGASSPHDGGGRSTARGGGGNDGVLEKSSVFTQSPSSMSPEAVSAAALWSSPSSPPIRITHAVVPIVLIDFGLSIQQDARARARGGRGGGTRPYIAPESWQGSTCTASDVWSLGCVLYALATCRLSVKDVRIMSQEAQQDGFASRMLNDIIAKKYSLAFASFVVSLLVVDPAKRPTAAQAAQCFCVADGEVRFDFRSPFFSNVLDL